MRSKTSCFNKTIFRKNMTRFAPVWGVYALCLAVGIGILYGNGGTHRAFHFANNMIGDVPYILALANLVYALVTVQLLFGDLYNSRVCNMLHAFPVSREGWFVTNVTSGLVMNLIPTAVMAVTAAPLLLGSLFENAVSLAFWIFLIANLQYICFFGMAVFAALCVGNRFTMVAGYGLMNSFAYIAYWLIDTIYTPMLYGVITPTALMYNLTPISHMMDQPYMQTESYVYELQQKFGNDLNGATASFTLTEQWWRLWVLAGVGLVFLMLALVLYKHRKLECAGDAVAFPALVPIFQVLCAIFVATAASYFMEHYLNMVGMNFPVLCLGLVVGWFIAQMLIERSTRVFRLRAFLGLGVLALVFGGSLLLTKMDVLGIQTYQPKVDEVEQVFFESDWSRGRYLKADADIEAMLRLQSDALANPAEQSGTYVLDKNGAWVRWIDSNDGTYADEGRFGDCTYVAEIGLRYELTSGKIVKRRYNVWVDTEAGAVANTYLSQWPELDYDTEVDGVEVSRLELVMQGFRSFSLNYMEDKEMPEICFDKEAAKELLEAVYADCLAGHMAQHPFFHNGYFRYENERSETGYSETESIHLSFASQKYGWYVQVYPDAVNTVRWLQNHDLLDYQVHSQRLRLW